MIRIITLALGGGLLLTACAQEEAPADERSAASSFGMIQDRTSSSPAEALFDEHCSMCHRNMGMGTLLLARRVDPAVAALEDRDNLTAEFVIQAARMGIGNMPAIGRGEVGDDDMQQIADYLASGGGE